MISIDLYIKNTIRYFDYVTQAFDSIGMIDKEVLALEEMIGILIKSQCDFVSELISPDKIKEIINEIKSGDRKIYYKGHPIKIVRPEEF